MVRFLTSCFVAIALMLSPVPVFQPIGVTQAEASLRKGIILAAVYAAVRYGGRALIRKAAHYARNADVKTLIAAEVVNILREEPQWIDNGLELLREIGAAQAIAELTELFGPVDIAEPYIGPPLPTRYPNVRHAGGAIPVTLADGSVVEVAIKPSGFADFSEYVKVEVYLHEFVGYERDMTTATEILKSMWKREGFDLNTLVSSDVTIDEIEFAVENELRKIPGYTWHHYEDCHTMQLVNEVLHDKLKHVGGVRIC